MKPNRYIGRQIIYFVRKRDGNRCAECGARRHLTVHHVVPIAQGGTKVDTRNMVTLCRSCHEGKHA